MNLSFSKYQGAGNDFIIIDDRKNVLETKNNKLIARLCDRKFGIGADGLMLLQPHDQFDFRMVYFNSDGFEGSMCGNGGRCITAFAHKLGIIKNKTSFIAVDGPHDAEIIQPEFVRLKMIDVENILKINGSYFLNTGSPHFVTFVDNLKQMDVYTEGRKIRYNTQFKEHGTNVNFVERQHKSIFVRTYERGVENETLACGTGIVASAISASIGMDTNKNSIQVKALGGNLSVSFERKGERFFNIWLEGQANLVFEGAIDTDRIL
ncbi:MAG: diaminopimelate epimerase [Bacteroidales bacterium]|nr:diaminopimelate epimerase [Bacteroidales bacterium]